MISFKHQPLYVWAEILFLYVMHRRLLWAPEPVWMFWRIMLYPLPGSNAGSPTHSIVSMLAAIGNNKMILIVIIFVGKAFCISKELFLKKEEYKILDLQGGRTI